MNKNNISEDKEKEIIQEIIAIFSKNNLSVGGARNILYKTREVIEENVKVTTSL